MNQDLFLAVMAGGSGTRFWPKSTSSKPKQLLKFHSHQTLLEQTLQRFDGLVADSNRIILTTEALSPSIEKLSIKARIFGEPQARNTAPCIYWAARWIASQNERAVMLVMPSDHFISDVPKFRKAVENAISWARNHQDLVTLGVQPTCPETGYGYLRVESKRLEDQKLPRKVEAFIEKPNLKAATQFFQEENYLWNGGMFIWQVQAILDAFDCWMPQMRKAWEDSDGDLLKAYPLMTATSIDFGVMEKASQVVTFPLDCGWNDLGSWMSLETLGPQLGIQKDGNTVSEGEVLALESLGNIIDVPCDKWIALLGVNDLIIVENQNTLLIAQKDRAQEIKKLVEATRKVRLDLV
jgi:mannose-1-phosphate guanylyltransferase